ncbi:MAG TPA: pyrroline-5-carboxylate reductase [Acidiphilium sp.]|nr:MAG: pyrroline-5-carboxylate reductase [Acidiphilium sp. 21-60-14]OYV92500.1 MAG: pyrroline-5-carboxylate reductase [Acidiphilium sp. 37-60-79]OZB40954.1 MAG: pyrroline-5-carboxylate reductase [Acidiphilium sp. 34-60-192]HQT87929.1 pyrroline-5-carboxylate reductase [Acidiphilium sp.]HQU22701.1 pyrroline-5-carboxylate reductase [Acidiphilium sp.]
MTQLPALLLLGGGKMGSALLAGWRTRGVEQVVVIDPDPAATALADGKVTVVTSCAAIPAGFAPAAIILAVKPQLAAEALAPLAGRIGDAVVISIMAGKTIAWLRALCGAEAAVLRAMPNTPAAVRQGVTVVCAGANVRPTQIALAEALLGCVGIVSFIENEALLDPVTAVSGSGPAYVFLLVELLEQAAIAQGIPADLAATLARQTVIGAGALLAASDQPAASLRKAVTSKAGTTEQALAVLMDPIAWPSAVNAAIAAATQRSRELSG